MIITSNRPQVSSGTPYRTPGSSFFFLCFGVLGLVGGFGFFIQGDGATGGTCIFSGVTCFIAAQVIDFLGRAAHNTSELVAQVVGLRNQLLDAARSPDEPASPPAPIEFTPPTTPNDPARFMVMIGDAYRGPFTKHQMQGLLINEKIKFGALVRFEDGAPAGTVGEVTK